MSTATSDFVAPPGQSLLDVVDALKQEWRDGSIPDLHAAIQQHPSLLRHRSLVVDLAYEEFCLREASGPAVDVEEFCRELPAYRSQVRKALLGHQFLAAHPELFATTEPDWPAPGRDVNGINLVRELGRGAFARAYLGCDVEAGGRPVVVKLSPSPTLEARTLGRLNHPNIGAVLWARRDAGMFAICMPFVGEATLKDLIELAFRPGCGQRGGNTVLELVAGLDRHEASYETPLQHLIQPRDPYPLAVASIANPLAAGLAHLHERGITHGDLKPSNVILGQGGKPYLIDFNLSHSGGQSLLMCGGTLPYMAPEQIDWLLDSKSKVAPTKSADVFSFGVVLYELLTGALPQAFDDAAAAEAAATRLLRAWRCGTAPIRSISRDVPARLAALVHACLALDPERRPTAARLHRELSRLLRPSRRVYAIATVCAAIIAAVVVWHEARPGTVHEETPSIHTAATAEDFFDLGVRKLAAGKTAQALPDFEESGRLKPNGRTLAFIGYVHARMGHHLEAEGFYRRALAEQFEPAWVYNNLGYSLAKLDPRPSPRLREALALVTRARDRSPGMRAIQFNWAWLRYLSHVDPAQERLHDSECVAALEQALESGPADSDLHFKAALIFAAASHDRPDLRAKAISRLRTAIAKGKKPKSLEVDPVLRANLGSDRDYLELLKSPENPPQQTLNLRLVNPIE